MAHHCKTQSELADTIQNNQKWMLYLEGEQTSASGQPTWLSESLLLDLRY